MNKTVVVIDSGGRGAALAYAYSKSPHVGRIIVIPGNDLIQINTDKKIELHAHLKTTSVAEILKICRLEKADLIDVAQDNAVEAGLADILQKNKFNVVGPTKSAGQLEWDKAFSRNFMQDAQIPQPEFFIFYNPQAGIEFLSSQKDQAWFVKASGLCEGKGALPAKNNAEAEERIIELQKFGDAARTFILEKWIKSHGEIAEEFSAFAVSDGESFQIIGFAQDHKRALDADQGENTGGMGCVSSPLVVSKQIHKQTEEIFKKTFDGMKEMGRPYQGILYLGGIIIGDQVYVIEFNARWGDPEAEVIVPGIKNDFFELGLAVSKKQLSTMGVKTDGKVRISVAAAAKGYPGDYSNVKGKEIIGIEEAAKMESVKIFGAGIKKDDNRYVVSGGRILHVVGEGRNVLEAREKAYQAIKLLSIEGNNLHFRTDIGWRDVARLKNL